MGGGQSRDGIDGEKPYWVHISRMDGIKGLWLEHQDYQFDGYIVTEWIDDKGKILRNNRGTSGFTRHGHYRSVSHQRGAVFNEFMEFNVMFTQLCRLRFKLCERKLGINGMWDHTAPLAVSEPTAQTLMEMVKGGLLGEAQTIEFHHPKGAEENQGYSHVAMRMSFSVGDRDVAKPLVASEALKDMGNNQVELVEDVNGDGHITLDDHNASVSSSGPPARATMRPPLLTANSVNLARKPFAPVSEAHPDDDV